MFFEYYLCFQFIYATHHLIKLQIIYSVPPVIYMNWPENPIKLTVFRYTPLHPNYNPTASSGTTLDNEPLTPELLIRTYIIFKHLALIQKIFLVLTQELVKITLFYVAYKLIIHVRMRVP